MITDKYLRLSEIEVSSTRLNVLSLSVLEPTVKRVGIVNIVWTPSVTNGGMEFSIYWIMGIKKNDILMGG